MGTRRGETDHLYNKELIYTHDKDVNNQELIRIGSETVDDLQNLLLSIHAVAETDPDATASTYQEKFFALNHGVDILNHVFIGLLINDIYPDK